MPQGKNRLRPRSSVTMRGQHPRMLPLPPVQQSHPETNRSYNAKKTVKSKGKTKNKKSKE